MNYKLVIIILLSVGLICLQIMWGIMYLHHPALNNVYDLLELIKVGVGYSNPMLYATILGWIYMIILNGIYERHHAYYILRMSRPQYYKVLLSSAGKWNIVFSIIYLLAQEINIMRCNVAFWFNAVFLKREIIFFLAIIMIHSLNSAVFTMNYVLFHKNAILISCVMITAIYVLGLYWPDIFFVYNDIYVVDSSKTMLAKIVVLMRNACLSGIIYVVILGVFKKRDLLDCEK